MKKMPVLFFLKDSSTQGKKSTIGPIETPLSTAYFQQLWHDAAQVDNYL